MRSSSKTRSMAQRPALHRPTPPSTSGLGRPSRHPLASRAFRSPIAPPPTPDQERPNQILDSGRRNVPSIRRTNKTMVPSKLRQVVGAVKDQTSIGLAKVGASSAASSELDVAIVKATRHSERFPAEERHVREILALSRGGEHAAACVSSLSRRLGRTRSWAVALKTLAVVQRLLADGDPALERELLCATRRGTRVLNLSDFCDRSRADAWDFSAFVRAYAAYLNDRLELRAQARQRGGVRPLSEEMYSMASPGNWSPHYHDDNVSDADGDKAVAVTVTSRDTPIGEMTVGQLFTKANQLQRLLDRFIACRPVGAAMSNRVVAVSLYPVVKESVQLYCELTEVMGVLIERFPAMETADCERMHELFAGFAMDMDELQAFYAWCKDACVCRQSDVPEIEVVTQKKLELMDAFIRDRRAAESQHQRLPSPEPAASPEVPPFVEEEHDVNATKALPAPDEPPMEEDDNAGKTTHQPEPEPLLLAAEPADGEADFLNLKADAMSSEAHGQQMALALFDGGNPSGTAPTGDAFDPSSADWETTLVQSASTLATQRAELGGGFNMMVLDGMYSHATASATVASAQAFSGSASSVAMRPPGAPMLALPGPPGTSGTTIGTDPFAASAVVPPPMYVQMSDLQMKQQLLTEEQMVWQRYGKNGMQGPGALAMLEQRPHQQLMPHGGPNYYAVYHRSS